MVCHTLPVLRYRAVRSPTPVRVQTIDAEPKAHGDYWHALAQLMQQQLDYERAAERADRAAVAAGPGAGAAAAGGPALPAVEEIVAEALSGSLAELHELEEMVEAELSAPACPDPNFWLELKPKCALCLNACRTRCVHLLLYNVRGCVHLALSDCVHLSL